MKSNGLNKWGRKPIWRKVAEGTRVHVSEVTCHGCSGTGEASYGECVVCSGEGKITTVGEWVTVEDINRPEGFSISEFFEVK